MFYSHVQNYSYKRIKCFIHVFRTIVIRVYNVLIINNVIHIKQRNWAGYFT